MTAREAGLMKAARAEYGDIVPELYGHEGANLLMEYAGTPLRSIAEGKGKIATNQLKTITNKVEGFLEKSWGSGNIVYMDPHSGNVAFQLVGNDVKVKMLDWGGSLYRSELRTSPLSPDALKSTIKKRIGSYDETIQDLATTVAFKEINYLQKLQQFDENVARQVADGKGPYIEGLLHGGLNEQMRHTLTPFGGPINWIKNLFGVGKKDLLSQLEHQGVVVVPQSIVKKFPQGFEKLSGAFVSAETFSNILADIPDTKSVLKWLSQPNAARQKLQEKGSGIIVSEATVRKGTKFTKEAVQHEQLHELFYNLGMSGESAASIAKQSGTGGFFEKSKGFAQFRKEYMQSSEAYVSRPSLWEEEYLAHARGSMARGMTKQERTMYGDAVQFLADKLPQAGRMSQQPIALQREMANMQREAQEFLFKSAKNGGKGHRLQKR